MGRKVYSLRCLPLSSEDGTTKDMIHLTTKFNAIFKVRGTLCLRMPVFSVMPTKKEGDVLISGYL